jgi:hypothetical protein
MLTSIKGMFRDGRVELDEDPGIRGEAPVVVTFLQSPASDASTAESKPMTFGMLADPARRMSDQNDFKIAEYDDTGWGGD